MKITRIKDEENLVRDLSSNAILCKTSDDSLEKRRNLFKQQVEDINTLKREISEIKNSMKTLMDFVKKGMSE